MDALDGLPLALANGIGVVGVVLVVGWLVWTGRLIPKATHDAQIKDLRDRIADEQHEKGEWRTEARLNQQTTSELNEQNRALTSEIGGVLRDFLTGLRRAGTESTNHGQGDES